MPTLGGSLSRFIVIVPSLLGYLLFPYVWVVRARNGTLPGQGSRLGYELRFLLALVIPGALAVYLASVIGVRWALLAYYSSALILASVRAALTRSRGDFESSAEEAWGTLRFVAFATLMLLIVGAVQAVSGILEAVQPQNAASAEGTGSERVYLRITKTAPYVIRLTLSAVGAGCSYSSTDLSLGAVGSFSIAGEPVSVLAGHQQTQTLADAATLTQGTWSVSVVASSSCRWTVRASSS
jgi:hypothetical protein